MLRGVYMYDIVYYVIIIVYHYLGKPIGTIIYFIIVLLFRSYIPLHYTGTYVLFTRILYGQATREAWTYIFTAEYIGFAFSSVLLNVEFSRINFVSIMY